MRDHQPVRFGFSSSFLPAEVTTGSASRLRFFGGCPPPRRLRLFVGLFGFGLGFRHLVVVGDRGVFGNRNSFDDSDRLGGGKRRHFGCFGSRLGFRLRRRLFGLARLLRFSFSFRLGFGRLGRDQFGERSDRLGCRYARLAAIASATTATRSAAPAPAFAAVIVLAGFRHLDGFAVISGCALGVAILAVLASAPLAAPLASASAVILFLAIRIGIGRHVLVGVSDGIAVIVVAIVGPDRLDARQVRNLAPVDAEQFGADRRIGGDFDPQPEAAFHLVQRVALLVENVEGGIRVGAHGHVVAVGSPPCR